MKIIKLIVAFVLCTSVITSCTDYGKKTVDGKIEVYYKDGILETDAKHTASFLSTVDKGENKNETVTRSFQLLKTNDTVCLKLVADKEKLVGVKDFSFLAIGNMLSDSVFGSKPVNVDLTNDQFETFKTIHYKKIDFNNLPPEDQQ